jgi:hypothetical protein
MRQRLSLARVLLHDPDVLLLDEPTASLDPVAARQARGLIADLGADKNRTVVLCTHDLAEAERLCDRVAILERGGLKALGTPGDLAAATGRSDVVVEVHPDDTHVAAKLQTDEGIAGSVGEPGRVRWPRATRDDIPHLVHGAGRRGGTRVRCRSSRAVPRGRLPGPPRDVARRGGVRMNGWRIVRAIALRDLRLLVANKITVISMVVLPLVIFVALPLLVGLVPTTMNVPVDNLDILVDVMPEEEAAELPADPDARLAVLLGYLLAPMFLLVPLMLSVVAAAGSIAGERERRTLETLLLSPATDRQLFLAKTAGAWVPPS